MEKNHTEWHSERLKRRAETLGEALQGGYLVGERLEQVQHEMSLIAFEQWSRHQEQIEEAWNE